jgi:hypothetical protein
MVYGLVTKHPYKISGVRVISLYSNPYSKLPETQNSARKNEIKYLL